MVVWDFFHQQYDTSSGDVVHVLGEGFPSFRAPKTITIEGKENMFFEGNLFPRDLIGPNTQIHCS